MGVKTEYAPGTFCWCDVRTTDQDGAKRFYTRLFGWDTVDRPIGDGIYYSMVKKNGHTVASIAPLTDGELANGVRQHWNTYISVADAGATVARARELGGRVLAEPADFYDAGRLATIQDPSGAIVSLWQPLERFGAELTSEPGCSCWDELATNDTEAASAFYCALFGWTVAAESPDPGSYTVFMQGNHMVGGMMRIQPYHENSAPRWGVCFAVEDTGAAIAQAQSMGGAVLDGPADYEEIGRSATLRDPQGGVFSVLQPAPDS